MPFMGCSIPNVLKACTKKWKNSEKIKVLKSVNLHPEYVPRCLRNQMQKKVEFKLTSKKSYEHSSRRTWNEKVGECFINYYYLTVKVKKTGSL